MKSLYTEHEFNSAKSTDLLLLKCYECDCEFKEQKKNIKYAIAHNTGKCKFCSVKCFTLNSRSRIETTCGNCNKEMVTYPAILNKSKSGKVFCCQSCACTFSNTHKTIGNRRSKLEAYIEEQLTIQFPELEIHFNRKDTIGSELDIYIPSLKLAFELNGIFHYEPIFGDKKFDQITTNDISKTKACFNLEIDLCIIDTSGEKYFKASTSKKYLDIITKIVNER